MLEIPIYTIQWICSLIYYFLRQQAITLTFLLYVCFRMVNHLEEITHPGWIVCPLTELRVQNRQQICHYHQDLPRHGTSLLFSQTGKKSSMIFTKAISKIWTKTLDPELFLLNCLLILQLFNAAVNNECFFLLCEVLISSLLSLQK